MVKRLLLSVVIIGIVLGSALKFSIAFFSDMEVSTGNTFAAGDIDLAINNSSYYNGVLQPDGTTTWTSDDITDKLFFNFLDIKPGDWGEDTIGLSVNTNDAWACYELEVTHNDDMDCTEPELLDDPSCVPGNDDLLDGELADQVNFALWIDDGDNVYETHETIIYSGLIDENLAIQGALADSTVNLFTNTANTPLTGGLDYYLGTAWCFGEMVFDPVEENAGVDPTIEDGIDCNGTNVNNASQTDTLKGDIGFYVEQARNNPDFVCESSDIPPFTCEPSDTPIYASLVTSSDQGTLKSGAPITDSTRTNPTNALGAPNSQFFSLGNGGEIIVEFATPVVDEAGQPDISIHEITNGRFSYPEEKAEVFVSADNNTYVSIGFATSEPGLVGADGMTLLDINGAVAFAKYVKVVDATNYGPHASSADGFDLDSVDAHNGLCSINSPN